MREPFLKTFYQSGPQFTRSYNRPITPFTMPARTIRENANSSRNPHGGQRSMRVGGTRYNNVVFSHLGRLLVQGLAASNFWNPAFESADARYHAAWKAGTGFSRELLHDLLLELPRASWNEFTHSIAHASFEWIEPVVEQINGRLSRRLRSW